MEKTHLTPDHLIFLQLGSVTLNATIVFTWIVMAALTVASIILIRSDSPCRTAKRNRWLNLMELLIDYGRSQLKDLGISNPDICLPFVLTIFLFIATSAMAGIIPGFHPPTASLSTTAALAVCVLVAVPVYGITARGILPYLHHYLEPTWIMLPFHIIGELTRTVALAVRLFGNTMSETMIVAVCLTIAPFFFPIPMKVLGLLTGMVQAYIFSIMAALYIGAGISVNIKSKQSS
jgi:F-type H+-transporting ATPase subunit a